METPRKTKYRYHKTRYNWKDIPQKPPNCTKSIFFEEEWLLSHIVIRGSDRRQIRVSFSVIS